MTRILSFYFIAFLFISCKSNKQASVQPLALPVLQIQSADVVTYQYYPATVEGVMNIEIRPQIDGILARVYADEGSYVRKGQPLFKIDEAPFLVRLNMAVAQMHAAEGALSQASLEVLKLRPLVDNKVVSDHQLKVAEAAYQVSVSNLQQAKALVAAAEIDLGYTLIRAPANGYISRLLKKQGSLIGPKDVLPLTLLSDVQPVHVYFALAETDFIHFKNQYPGASLQEKLANLPPVSLILPDQSTYTSTGKIDMVDGQFDKTTGSIILRASFPNAEGALRSGNTGKVQLPLKHADVAMVPQAATVELQDKVFVFMIDSANKVMKQPIEVIGRKGTDYLVRTGVRSGDRIITESLDRLQEGQVIQPQTVKPGYAASISSN
jgi:membrane fusion protein, multidrug efflux system